MHRERATNLFPLCPDRDHLLSPRRNTNPTAVLVSNDVPLIRVGDDAKFTLATRHRRRNWALNLSLCDITTFSIPVPTDARRQPSVVCKIICKSVQVKTKIKLRIFIYFFKKFDKKVAVNGQLGNYTTVATTEELPACIKVRSPLPF